MAHMGSIDQDHGRVLAGGAAATRIPALIFAAGNTAYATGDLARAEALYRRVLSLQPGHVSARDNLAALLLDQNRRIV